ncbi:hypothetical protein BKA62DRAFT_299255 [Auriculariales sp. MPI-PUGE-AT-0066]|nr:hypothetical protein BKA62DRAFT_299255 [Auriculariales sp. MPI-PUGE-AT-0066]
MEEFMQKTYMGKSSEAALVIDTFDFKFGEGFRIHLRDHSASWRRPEFWSLPQYESKDEYAHIETPFHAELPPRDLFVKLLDAYFDHVNVFLPLLHKGLFLQQLSAGMHRRDPQFLAVLLLVFALASRCIQDPRVLNDPSQPRSAGWKYFDMAEPMTRATFLINGRLFDLQTKVLASCFLWGSTVPVPRGCTSVLPSVWPSRLARIGRSCIGKAQTSSTNSGSARSGSSSVLTAY